jgi:hypothetical protein
MLPALLAQIGLPLLVKAVGAGLSRIDHPAAAGAAAALDAVDKAVTTSEITPEQVAEANRHVERMTEIEAETGRAILTEVNASLRAEIASEDKYVRRMRPTFGYVMAATWAVQMGATSWAVIDSPRDAPAVLAALAETWWLWTVALSVLGIYVAGRSKEKGSSLLGALPFPVPGRKPGR